MLLLKSTFIKILYRSVNYIFRRGTNHHFLFLFNNFHLEMDRQLMKIKIAFEKFVEHLKKVLKQVRDDFYSESKSLL